WWGTCWRTLRWSRWIRASISPRWHRNERADRSQERADRGRSRMVAQGMARRAVGGEDLGDVPWAVLSVRDRIAGLRPLRSDVSESRDAGLSADGDSYGGADGMGARNFLCASDEDRRQDGAAVCGGSVAPGVYPPVSSMASVHHGHARSAVLPDGQRRAGTRPVLANRVRRAGEHVRWTGRRGDKLFAGNNGGGAFGVCRRDGGQSDHAMVRDRDVAAVVLFSSGAGGDNPARPQRRGDVFPDRRDHELHQLGGVRPGDSRDGGIGAGSAVRGGGARAGRLAMADHQPARDSVGDGLRDRGGNAVDSRLYPRRECAFAAWAWNPGAGIVVGKPACRGGRRAEPQALSVDPDPRNLHLSSGDVIQLSRGPSARPARPGAGAMNESMGTSVRNMVARRHLVRPVRAMVG